MITQIFFTIIYSILGFIFALVPNVTELPFGIDIALSTAVGWLRDLESVAWPLEVMFDVVLWYLLFKVFMITLRLFLGSRTPHAGSH